ncbi:hypothetical protein NDU88_001245 [Pleurodeles waltl]|uniref:Uncharacterized protein n=1 Tax=Pleurodeles waltl TaxID=8319 RepID=A0AAV7S820_PLEWA|nr:hypothetical protein NDU88_001245 [Pleurodeles waltl]
MILGLGQLDRAWCRAMRSKRGPVVVRGCAGSALQGVMCLNHDFSSYRLLATLEGVAVFFRSSGEAHAVEGVAVGRCPGLKCCGLEERA